jgi:hypothetical protein
MGGGLFSSLHGRGMATELSILGLFGPWLVDWLNSMIEKTRLSCQLALQSSTYLKRVSLIMKLQSSSAHNVLDICFVQQKHNYKTTWLRFYYYEYCFFMWVAWIFSIFMLCAHQHPTLRYCFMSCATDRLAVR